MIFAKFMGENKKIRVIWGGNCTLLLVEKLSKKHENFWKCEKSCFSAGFFHAKNPKKAILKYQKTCFTTYILKIIKNYFADNQEKEK